MDIDHLKLRMVAPAPFWLGLAVIAGMDALLIFPHKAETIQAGHGIVTSLLCAFSIFGWWPLLFANPYREDDFDWIPSALIVGAALCVSVVFGFGYKPLPYELWSYHTFFFWLLNAFFTAVGLSYFAMMQWFD